MGTIWGPYQIDQQQVQSEDRCTNQRGLGNDENDIIFLFAKYSSCPHLEVFWVITVDYIWIENENSFRDSPNPLKDDILTNIYSSSRYLKEFRVIIWTKFMLI